MNKTKGTFQKIVIMGSDVTQNGNNNWMEKTYIIILFISVIGNNSFSKDGTYKGYGDSFIKAYLIIKIRSFFKVFGYHLLIFRNF